MNLSKWKTLRACSITLMMNQLDESHYFWHTRINLGERKDENDGHSMLGPEQDSAAGMKHTVHKYTKPGKMMGKSFGWKFALKSVAFCYNHTGNLLRAKSKHEDSVNGRLDLYRSLRGSCWHKGFRNRRWWSAREFRQRFCFLALVARRRRLMELDVLCSLLCGVSLETPLQLVHFLLNYCKNSVLHKMDYDIIMAGWSVDLQGSSFAMYVHELVSEDYWKASVTIENFLNCDSNADMRIFAARHFTTAGSLDSTSGLRCIWVWVNCNIQKQGMNSTSWKWRGRNFKIALAHYIRRRKTCFIVLYCTEHDGHELVVDVLHWSIQGQLEIPACRWGTKHWSLETGGWTWKNHGNSF